MYSLTELWFIISKLKIRKGWEMLKKWIKYGVYFEDNSNVSYNIVKQISSQIKIYNEIRSRNICPIGVSIEEWNASIDRLDFVARKHLETYFDTTQEQIYFETSFWELLQKSIYNFWI